MKNIPLAINKSIVLVMLCLCALGLQAQTVTKTFRNAALSDVLAEIERQTNYSIAYGTHDINSAKRVTAKFNRTPLRTVLRKVLGNDFNFEINKRAISIYKGKKAESARSNTSSRPESSTAGQKPKRTVEGTVTNEEGEPIVGAVVVATGTTNGGVTDADGNFTIQVPSQTASISISYIGCKNKIVKLTPYSKPINVQLQEELKSLDEVVVVGYGSMKKKEMTSAISHVGAGDFNKVSSLDAGMLLQGKVSGLSVVNTGTGDPNQQASLQIRGVSSRSAGMSPLIVIDGVPEGNLTNINPNDIESIDVLKDGAASAIYGTRASNGVIIVNLKKGSRDGKIHTSYEVNYTANVAKREIDLLTANEFREYRTVNNNTLDKGGNTDWFDAATRTGQVVKQTLTISGGNIKTNYRVTVDHRYANGIDLRSDRKEYGARASINHTTASGLLTFTANIAPRYVKRKFSDWSWFSNLLRNNPTTDPVQSDGSYTDFWGQPGANVIEEMKTVKSDGEVKMLAWDGTAKLNILPLLVPKRDDMSLTARITFSEQHIDKFDGYYSPSTLNANIHENYKGQASRSYNNSINRNLDLVVNYTWDYKRMHHLAAMLGYSYGYGMGQGLNGNNKDFASDATSYNNLGSGEWLAAEKGRTGLGTFKEDHKLIGFFGRLNYNYRERYIASFSIRHEGSSRFGFNNKWGNFPAVSVGWRISDEPFMKWSKGWLTDLKLRYDYGVTGNQEIGNYQSLSIYRAFGYYIYDGKSYRVWGPANNVNPNLRWEKGHNQNVGIDFSLFNDRISGSVNYYHKKQVDLLGSYDAPVPPNLFSSIYANVGTLKNTGFEFELNVKPIVTRDFMWTISANAYTNNNEFVSFSNDVYKGQDYYNTCIMSNPGNPGYLQRIAVGERIGSFFTYRYAGVSDTGDWLIFNKDGKVINVAEGTEQDKSVTGNGLPKWNAALTNSITWKNFDASIFMRGAFGFDIFDVHDFYYGLQSFVGNVSSNAYRRNKLITTGSNVISDWFIHRGDYWKIESISLGYTFNINRRFIEKVRLYGTANNLYTFTHFPGVDPSTYQVNGLTPGTFGGNANYYPSCFSFIFGMQVTF